MEKEKSEEVDEEDCQGGRVLRKLRLPTFKPFQPIWLVWLEASTVTLPIQGKITDPKITSKSCFTSHHFISSFLIIHIRTVLCSTAQEKSISMHLIND